MSLAPAASVITWVFGALSVLCIVGFVLFRQRTVFAVRCPEVVLGFMVSKFLSFAFLGWTFLDPNCPCWAVTALFWFDWHAGYLLLLRKIVLLFRLEIQAALEKSKQQALTWDLNNVFIKYRHILKRGHQLAIMFLSLCWVGLGHMVLLIVYKDEDDSPCTNIPVNQSKLFVWSIVVSWIHFPFCLAISAWSTRRLASFPQQDNWKLALEGRITTVYMLAGCIVFVALCAGYPTNDAVLFWLLISNPILSFMNFLLPLRIWRTTMLQISRQELQSLAPLVRLLKEQVFLAAFDKFLKTEFSSENLYFWLEVDKLKRKYAALLPPNLEATKSSSSHNSLTPPGGDDSEDKQLLLAAAADLIQLGRQCVGSEAPWQVNISGIAEKEMEAWVGRLSAKMQAEENQKDYNLRALLEETFRALVVAQAEIYECLRRDPYPRFLLTPACEALNNDAGLKRLLAAEKLEGEVVKTDSPPRGPRSLGDSRSSSHSSENSMDQGDGHARSGSRSGSPQRPKQKRKSSDKDHQLVKQLSKPLFEVSLPSPAPAWNKHVKHLTEAARADGAGMLEVPIDEGYESRGSVSVAPRGSEAGVVLTETSSKLSETPPIDVKLALAEDRTPARAPDVIIEMETVKESGKQDLGVAATTSEAAST